MKESSRSLFLWILGGPAALHSDAARHAERLKAGAATTRRMVIERCGDDTGVPAEVRHRELYREIQSRLAAALDACAAVDREHRRGDGGKTLSRYQNILSRLQGALDAARKLGEPALAEIISREKEAVLLKMNRCAGPASR